jgi:hypothetical protein
MIEEILAWGEMVGDTERTAFKNGQQQIVEEHIGDRRCGFTSATGVDWKEKLRSPVPGRIYTS